MRLLLDAHVSGRRIGKALRKRGHDVLAVDEDEDLKRARDADLLELATSEQRILVTFDVKDFWRLLREWGMGGRSHTGCILVTGLRHDNFGPLLRGLDRLFEEMPDQEDWIDQTRFLPK